jgi:hypothetical protein
MNHSDGQRALCGIGQGEFSWVLENPEQFPDPVSLSGRLGLFDVPLRTRAAKPRQGMLEEATP